jgi:hypothetical protein
MFVMRCLSLSVFLSLASAVNVFAQDVSPEQARVAFEKLKALAGDWQAQSTNGWDGVHTIEVIAGGSAILSSSRISPHPGSNDNMATLLHMDGDRLLLTHYCVARNQPRLVATAVKDDGRTIEFSFLDGTGLRSRDEGHMDRVIYHLDSTDTYRSRWTFYQNGQERWLEDVVNVRRR